MSAQAPNLRARALLLCQEADLRMDSPTRGESLTALCESLVELARQCDDEETMSAWRDIYGAINAAVVQDLARIGRPA